MASSYQYVGLNSSPSRNEGFCYVGGDFLPSVRVSTAVYEDFTGASWFAALGDDLHRNRPLIEINLTSLREAYPELDRAARQAIDSWLAMYIVLASRQDLIHKQVRGDLSSDSQEILQKANYAAIKASPALYSKYIDLAIDSLIRAQGAPRWMRDIIAGWTDGGMLRYSHLAGVLSEDFPKELNV